MANRVAAMTGRWAALFAPGQASTGGSCTAVVILSGVTTANLRGLLPTIADVNEDGGCIEVVLPGATNAEAIALIRTIRTRFVHVRAGYSWSDGQASLAGLLLVAREAFATGRQEPAIGPGLPPAQAG
jgi:hypothetical protein